jgi:hypothetical protein
MIDFLKRIFKRMRATLLLNKRTRTTEDKISLISLKIYSLEKMVSEQARIIADLAQTQGDLARTQNDIVSFVVSPPPLESVVKSSSAYDKLAFMVFDDDDDMIN